MKKIILLLSATCFLFAACNDNGNGNTANEESATEQHAEEADHSHDGLPTELALNDGAKWQINQEMRPFIEKQAEVTKNFVDNKDQDYKRLGQDLYELNTDLIKSCTMKGPDHDMLHVWLDPHIKLLKSLKDLEGTDGGEQLVADINLSFESFNKYFE